MSDAADWSPGALLGHLRAAHGIEAVEVRELDVDVLHVVQHRGDVVVRVVPPTRSIEEVQGDAAVLERLAELDLPAERVVPDPVSRFGDRSVLVTEWVRPVPVAQRRDTIRAAGGLRRLGALTADLGAVPATEALARPGGAWHHAAAGRPDREVAAAIGWLDAVPATHDAAAAIGVLSARLRAADTGDGLPEAFVHPDLVLSNVVASAPDRMTLVDWANAGTAPRIWPLAFLLRMEGGKRPERAQLVAAGHRSRIRLDPAELDRLAAVMEVRTLVFLAWRLARGDVTPADAAASAEEDRRRCDEIAAAVLPILARRAAP